MMLAADLARAVARPFGILRDGISDGLLTLRIGPNAVTLMGPLVSCGVALAWANGDQPLGGWLLVAAGATDLIDGTMARRRGVVTKFGALLDAVVDRYSDLVVCAGLFLFFAGVSEPTRRTTYLALCFLCVCGSVIPSYARARAELFIPTCKVGYLERGERTVALFLGAMAGNLHLAVIIVAIFGNWVAIERVVYARRVMNGSPHPGGFFWRYPRLSPAHALMSAALAAFLLFGHHAVPRP
jgi:CDP-diacylglycerol--glycerol-3-phosphate 3-phosphatidyltransferase